MASDRALLAAGAIGLAFVASQAQAQEKEHVATCGCAGCAGGNAGVVNLGEATEEAIQQAIEEDAPERSEFQIGGRWSSFASGTSFVRGDPVTLTFGIVQEGTTLSDGAGGQQPSSLRSYLDTAIGSSDVWMPLIQEGYQRWAEVSGVTFIYEDNDDGVLSPNNPGILGTRADMRLGGHPIDGSVIGFNFFPNFGDGVLDTSSTAFFGNAANSFRTLRNTLTHEVGHGLGLSHFESDNSRGLMEPFIDTSFDGPQHGDILGIQRLYGDALEANGGNDSTTNATSLGQFNPGGQSQTLSIGTDADDNSTRVERGETDFISIDGTSDTDVFAITLTGDNSYDLTVQLDPKGPTFNQGPQDGVQTAFNTKALTNLELELLDGSGILIAAADANGAGLGELIQRSALPAGEYFVRISTGANAADNVQFYRLDVSAVEVEPEPVVSAFEAAHLAYKGSAFDGPVGPSTDGPIAVQRNQNENAATFVGNALGDDLINLGSSTLSQLEPGTTPTQFSSAEIHDGDGGVNNGPYHSDGAVPDTYTFTLNTSVNTQGYDIQSVQTFAGWTASSRSLANQRYQLLVSQVDDPGFVLLGEFTHIAFDGTSSSGSGASASEMVISRTGGVLATNVDAVRFVLLAHGVQTGANSGTVYREFDVIGQPSAASSDLSGSIASDKQPLLNGETADFDNYSSYTRGINRVVVDIQGLPNDGASLSADDFVFKVGNDDEPGSWVDAPPPNSPVQVFPGAGDNGSDRVVIDWADNAIQNQWLQVTVLSTDDTALPFNDQIAVTDELGDPLPGGVQFYYGNAQGETNAGNGPGTADVNITDAVGAFNNRTLVGGALIDNDHDFDRDGTVNITDAITAFNNRTNAATVVNLITPPGSAAWLAPVEHEALRLAGLLNTGQAK